jgi:hypothetical protein
MLEFEVLKSFSFQCPHVASKSLEQFYQLGNGKLMFTQTNYKKLKRVFASLKYLAFSCDEVITMDNLLWISIHCYVVQY